MKIARFRQQNEKHSSAISAFIVAHAPVDKTDSKTMFCVEYISLLIFSKTFSFGFPSLL